MFKHMQGKVILVTGGGSGIGEAFTVRAAEAGATIVAIDRNGDSLERLNQRLSVRDFLTVAADVTDSERIREVVDDVVARFGRLDFCFSNAGVAAPFLELADTPDELFDRVVRINQYGNFYVLKHVMAAMRRQRSGAIVCTSSTSGTRGVPAYAAYCASKHAVIGLVRVAAMDGAKYGIRVNAVCPGMTDTPINESVHRDWNPDDPNRAMQEVASRIPLARYAEPEEIAAAAAFLLSDASSYITGQVLNVDGGVTTGPGF